MGYCPLSAPLRMTVSRQVVKISRINRKGGWVVHNVVMSFQLPDALQTPDDSAALKLLGRYFNSPRHSSEFHTGSQFDGWDSTGTREADANQFTADDTVAVTFLSVQVRPSTAMQLLRDRAERFTELLTEVGEDRDLVDDDSVLRDDWVGWTLMSELQALPDIGPVTASKLFARKRPKLRPIYDDVVAAVTGSRVLWKPLYAALQTDDLHTRLLRLGSQAGLGEHVSALRIFDVIAWREGKDKGLGKRRSIR